ncbi:Beta-galactosidase [Aspergillus affinis]|uniref:Beta-galactosidase n=1 Tax=Aspergillus affinis TaxID=1070780 RepID=UPI0022FDD2D6|nr:Beta-galactosidase [Aspergillus affinis]KAI9037294.1 Beta-galactosidase [Aspergillus affinis]
MPEMATSTKQALQGFGDGWGYGTHCRRRAPTRMTFSRDRNHLSVIVWSYGNEVGEQGNYDAETAEITTYLRNIVIEEDTTRPSTGSIHRSTPTSLYTEVVEIINLNYQGEDMRYGPAYTRLVGNRGKPQYDAFHDAHPDKLVFGSEVAWSLSSRGSFMFPVTNYISSPINDTAGGNSSALEISAYELYSSDSGSSPDRVLLTQDEHPFAAGGFIWAG